jgi:hypothetical protein
MTPDEELKLLRADWAALVAQVTGGEGANFTGDKEHPNSVMRQALDALDDMYNGWRYIRESHGDLYGVGWGRAENKASAAIDALRRAMLAAPPAPSAEPVQGLLREALQYLCDIRLYRDEIGRRKRGETDDERRDRLSGWIEENEQLRDLCRRIGFAIATGEPK